MGLLGGLGKLLKGEPVFEPSNEPKNSPQPSRDGTLQPPAGGPKIIPMVQIERVELHNNGPHMRVVAAIQNDSEVMVELDKIRLLGTQKELDTQLRPGEEREFTVFEGQRPNHRNYDDAEVIFKDMNGDYFEARHVVEFQQEPDNTYSVTRFRFTGPVKDI